VLSGKLNPPTVTVPAAGAELLAASGLPDPPQAVRPNVATSATNVSLRNRGWACLMWVSPW
jgi:hypothetical protein